ncbi:hypothetical protein NEOKW01_1996 [Nematocida sp. AWRm80]|nr:hypothetical protein NEOKW01_1996 [Nematocida sp. AWRm80]
MPNTPEDCEKIANEYYDRNNTFLLRWFMNRDIEQAHSLYYKAGEEYLNTSNYNKAGEMFYKAAKVLQEDKEVLPLRVYGILEKTADSYYNVNKSKAVEIYIEAYNLLKKNSINSSTLGSLGVKIGRVYRELLQDKEALEYFYKSIELFTRCKMLVNKRNTLAQCGEIEIKLKNYQKAFKIFVDLSNDRSELSQILEKTTYQFLGVLSGIVLGKIPETLELINAMDETKIETKISFQLVNIKTERDKNTDELEKLIAYYRRTNKLTPETLIALNDAQVSLDPDTDIL